MISVIITSYDNHELTKVHVRECMNSSLMPDEIVVVNDGGLSSLEGMLRELDLKTRIVYARVDYDIPWNYTGARNLGVWLSKGDYLVSEDNDNIPSEHLYRDMFNCLEENKELASVRAGKRPLVDLEEALTKPRNEWTWTRRRQSHRDSYMIRRETYLKVKGYDERFAGKYAWACSDWRRRLLRAGLRTGEISTHYFTIHRGDTKCCECDKSREERAKTVYCKDCSLPFKRKSYENYHLARTGNHTQSPKGILNFTYDFKIL